MWDLPRWNAEPGDADRCLRSIDSWAAALRGHDVVAAFSVDAAREMERLRGAHLLDELDRFAGEHWDFRAGRERNLATVPDFSLTHIEAIAAAAQAFGLAGTPPPRRERYDAIVMTGGMVRAGVVKPRFARELCDGGVDAGEVVFLGGFRRFAGDEFDVAEGLGIRGDNEFDAMVAGMRWAFDLGAPNAVEGSHPAGIGREVEDRDHAAWRDESWEWRGRALRVVAAPSSDPQHRRANTADTFRFWAARAQHVSTVLVVTTPVYVPYQGAGAIEVLGLEYGMAVETVAVSGAVSDLGELTQEFLPHHCVQELRSAIRGLRQLRARLVGLGERG